MRGGTYRTGSMTFNQGITIQPYRDEVPVLKGTAVATEWQALRDGVWRTPWTRLFPQRPADWWQRGREGMRTPLHRFNNDMVFIDGRFLQSAGWEGGLDADTYYIDYEGGFVYIAVDPKGHLVEVTAHDSAFVRTTRPVHGKQPDRKGPVLRGLTLTQYAYRALEVNGVEPDGPADPATFGKDAVGTTLENMTITYCSRVAAYLRGDGLVIRNSLVSDTSTEGIYIIASSDVLLERNIFRRNNIERITGYYPSAVKIFNQTRRVTCRDNLVIEHPYSNGIWYDVGNIDGVFVHNWVEGALDGFFFEISTGAIAAGNVFVNCDKGIRALNSANVRAYQNTFVNSVASFERTPRSAAGDHFGWHPATGPGVDATARARLRGQPARRRRGVPPPAAQRRADAGPLRHAHRRPTRGARRQPLRAPGRRRPGAPHQLEPGDRRTVHGRARVARGAHRAAAGLRSQEPCARGPFRRALQEPGTAELPARRAAGARGRAGTRFPADILKAAGWAPDAKRAPGAFPAARAGAVR